MSATEIRTFFIIVFMALSAVFAIHTVKDFTHTIKIERERQKREREERVNAALDFDWVDPDELKDDEGEEDAES